MKKQKLLRLTLLGVVCVVLFTSVTLWAHGDGTTIVPASLNVKAGSELKVTVNGLIGTETATFWLTGIFGNYELGTFAIASDDFTQVLQIPSDIQPGIYRLTVEGGGKSAKVVITIN